MSKNCTSTDQSTFDRALSLPHFDEDATLISARPVVPLWELDAKPRSRRRAIFGLTILGAILIGASGTLMLLQSDQNSQNAPEVEVNNPTLLSSGAAGGPVPESAEPRIPIALPPAEKPPIRELKNARDSLAKRSTKAAVLPGSAKPVSVANPEAEKVEDFENDERQLRRAQRRNARRETRRELRNRREQRQDDLLRIREIFEGSPRP